MRHEVRKIALIANELVTMLMLARAEKEEYKRMDVKYERKAEHTRITIIQYDCTFSEEFINKIRDSLNIPRQCEVEEYYWQLAGENESQEELFIVGSMVNKAIVEMRDGNLFIEMYRNAKNLDDR